MYRGFKAAVACIVGIFTMPCTLALDFAQQQSDDGPRLSIERGILIVDGKYVPPPYDLQNGFEGKCSINGTEFVFDWKSDFRIQNGSDSVGNRRPGARRERVNLTTVDTPADGPRARLEGPSAEGQVNRLGVHQEFRQGIGSRQGNHGGGARGGMGGPRREGFRRQEFRSDGFPTEREEMGEGWDFESGFDRLVGGLETGGMVVIRSNVGQPDVFTVGEAYPIVEALLAEDVELQMTLPVCLESCAIALRNDTTFQRDATEFYHNLRDVVQANERSAQNTLLLDRIAYPLTTFGMLMVVFATGQLLIHRPQPEKDGRECSDQSATGTIKFVAIILAFSVLDLIWTILANSQGSIRELNPIGSHLVSDPKMLIAFKVVTTGGAAAILIYLRRIYNAQIASWWMCLLLTLLTARWLVFHSMMV